MPRVARLDAPGTLHHVMIRGIEGVDIFRDDQDRQTFVSRIDPLVKNTGTRILAWVLMGSHVHLLLLSGPEGISQFMRRLLTGYAIYYNGRHRRRGHLFQNRYKSIVCEEEPYLLELVRYIHLNPIRAGLVKGLAELDGYPWSGHSVLVGKRKNDWQEVGYVLRFFGGDKRRAVRAYRRFMEEGQNQGRRLELVGGGLVRSLGGWSKVLSLRGSGGKMEYDARVLGGGDFVSQILREADEKVRRQLPSRDKEEIIDRIIGKVCEEEGVEEKEVRLGGQRRRVSKARARIAHELSCEWGIPMAEIARKVGVSTSAIANALNNRRRKSE